MHWIQKPNRCPYLYTIWVLTIVLFNQLWVGCWLGIVVFWDKAAKATKTLHKLTPLTFSNFSAKILQAFSSEAHMKGNKRTRNRERRNSMFWYSKLLLFSRGFVAPYFDSCAFLFLTGCKTSHLARFFCSSSLLG